MGACAVFLAVPFLWLVLDGLWSMMPSVRRHTGLMGRPGQFPRQRIARSVTTRPPGSYRTSPRTSLSRPAFRGALDVPGPNPSAPQLRRGRYVVLGLLFFSGSAFGATYTVTSLADSATPPACTGTTPNFSCTTLRAALTAADLTAAVNDTILFSGSGTINLVAVLPTVTDTLVINGGGDITLNGGGANFSAVSFVAGATGSQLLNIGITNFAQPAVAVNAVSNMVISGNTFTGASGGPDAIRCFNSDNCTVTNNTITNGFYGISIFNNPAIAGFNATVTGNTISGTNYGVGIASATNVLVDSNNITGTNFAGIRLVPQFGGAGSNTDSNTLTNNIITGNIGSGIAFEGAAVAGATQISDNLVQSNTLTNNGGAGITLNGNANTTISQNTITGNTITGNAGDGVRITGATASANAVYANTNISGNGGLGIDLDNNGVTLNDAGDGDIGPNGLQNFPVLSGISGTTVNFTLDTNANANGYRVDFYNNPGGVDPTGFGEGQIWLGSCVVTGVSATLPSNCSIAGVDPATLRMTATRCQNAGCVAGATTSIGPTSEFSGPAIADLLITKTNTPGLGPSDQPSDSVARGATTTYSIVVTNSGANSVIGAVLRDPAASRSGLTCSTAPTCTGTGCPASPITLAALDSGVALGNLTAGSDLTVLLTCTVN